MPLRLQERGVTIADGAAVSESFRLHNEILTGLRVPASWAATAVEIRFEESSDPFTVADGSATFRRILDAAGAEIKITGVASSQSRQIVPGIGPWSRIRLVGTTAVPANVNQTGAKVVTVLTKVEGN